VRISVRFVRHRQGPVARCCADGNELTAS